MTIVDGFTLSQLGLIPTNHLQAEKHRPPDSDEVAVCMQWFASEVVPAEQMNSRTAYHAAPTALTSYAAKHQVEAWTEEQTGVRKHIHQGAFAQAALQLGYRVEPIKHRGRVKQSVKITVWLREDDWQRVWPTDFSRWLFRRRKEKSPLGDLARDAFSDPQWPRRATAFAEFRAYLTPRADLRAIDVLVDAWEQYSGEKVVPG